MIVRDVAWISTWFQFLSKDGYRKLRENIYIYYSVISVRLTLHIKAFTSINIICVRPWIGHLGATVSFFVSRALTWNE